MKIMGPGSGFLLCIGSGIGVGLHSRGDWLLQACVASALIAIAHILLKSEHYQDYMHNCKSGGRPEIENETLRKLALNTEKTLPSKLQYFILSFSVNIAIILAVTLAVRKVFG